ncbi:MAG: alkaline phosphatase PhoX [Pseudomonadota bacterium]
MNNPDFSENRRSLLKGFASANAIPFLGAFAALQSKMAMADNVTTLVDSPYGPIVPTNDITTGLPLLQLPAGFTYKSFGWRGDLMTDGRPCPGGHDGMGVVVSRKAGRSTELVLVRNHEIGFTAPANFINASGVFDRGTASATSPNKPGGGTTNMVFRDGNWVGVTPSLGGTQGNCAGGLTPWGTWLTCEEVGSDAVSTDGKRHGYVFEVNADPALTSGAAIVGMGRFGHEAAAVDPTTGNVYMTEDSSGKSGFYRYVPIVKTGAPGSLAQGGQLQMAKVRGMENANLATVSVADTYTLDWVDIADPDQLRGNATGPTGITITNASGPFVQGWTQGGARMNRGEGMWYFAGKIYVMDTSGGSASRGTVWELNLAQQTITCIYSSPSNLVGNMGDNLTVSPRGGLLLCEDGGAVNGDAFGVGQRLMGLTAEGDPYIFAKNNVNLTPGEVAAAGKSAGAAGDNRTNEFAGACFDPTGRYLFANIQTPGITFAISGPWAKGPM